MYGISKANVKYSNGAKQNTKFIIIAEFTQENRTYYSEPSGRYPNRSAYIRAEPVIVVADERVAKTITLCTR